MILMLALKVVTSGSFVSGQSVMTSSDKFCNREFIWTLHRFQTHIYFHMFWKYICTCFKKIIFRWFKNTIGQVLKMYLHVFRKYSCTHFKNIFPRYICTCFQNIFAHDWMIYLQMFQNHIHNWSATPSTDSLQRLTAYNRPRCPTFLSGLCFNHLQFNFLAPTGALIVTVVYYSITSAATFWNFKHFCQYI